MKGGTGWGKRWQMARPTASAAGVTHFESHGSFNRAAPMLTPDIAKIERMES
jgi:hypothetical protein